MLSAISAVCLADFGEPRPVELGKAHEAGLPACRDLLRRVVGAEEPGFVVLVERDESGNPPRQPAVPAQRPVFRLGKLQPGPQPEQRGGQRGCAHRVQRQSRVADCHRFAVYTTELTVA